MNGDTNMKALEAAAEAGVPRAAFISAHKFPFPSEQPAAPQGLGPFP